MFRMLIINTRKICLNFNASESFTNMTIDGAIDKMLAFCSLLRLLFLKIKLPPFFD